MAFIHTCILALVFKTILNKPPSIALTFEARTNYSLITIISFVFLFSLHTFTDLLKIIK